VVVVEIGHQKESDKGKYQPENCKTARLPAGPSGEIDHILW